MSNDSKSERKKPSQGRSIELVETIFEASVRILKGVGLKSFSTRKVADIAGVSVGSLYQYFPNKEALLGALIEREANKHVRMLEKKYLDVQSEDLKKIIHILIGDILNTVSRDKVLLKIILASTFAVERLESIIAAREGLIALVEKILKDKSDISDERTRIVSYLIVASLGGIIETIIFRKDDQINIETIIDEATLMTSNYIK